MSKGAATREAILHCGVEQAAKVGLSGLTIGALADATGMSKSGLFAHAKSKQELQLRVLEQARAEYIDAVIRPALGAPRGEPRVRALFEHWLASARDRAPGGCLFVKAAAEFDDRPGPVRDQLVKDHKDKDDTVAQIFSTGVAEGHFRPDADPYQFAAELQSLMLGYFHLHRLMHDPDAEQRLRTSFENLLDQYRVK
ncbi:MAG TPA: TetR/AcrR family transcriptional regulator [Jiangellaceae bacterium]